MSELQQPGFSRPVSQATEDGLPIDAVITWVDGNDPTHRDKLNRYLATLGQRPRVAAPTRYASVGEINYCVLSLLKFAPFVRRIYIVTDSQRPSILEHARDWDAETRSKLALVDHRDIFAGHEDCLPTFNSRTIESMIWRVPGLAEHFVYLNDDFVLIRPVAREAWFRDGRPVLHGKWRRPLDAAWGRRARRWLLQMLGRPYEPPPAHRRGQTLAASLVGYEHRYFHVWHAAHPLRRSTLADYFDRHPEALHSNIEARLRSVQQFWTIALAHHLEIRAGQAILDSREVLAEVEPQSMTPDELTSALRRAESDFQIVYVCLQSLDAASPEVRQLAVDWLERIAGSPTAPVIGAGTKSGTPVLLDPGHR